MGKSVSAARELLAIALPTMAQTVSYTLMQFIDTWMLSRLGDTEAAAGGLAGLMAFAVICFGFGVLHLVNTLVSQSYGRGESRACGLHLWQGIWWALLYCALIAPVVPFVGGLFEAIHGPRMAALETSYATIVLISAPLKLMGMAIGQFLLAVNRPRAVFYGAAIGVGFNVLTAWLLVFGSGGFPALGVAGAAWAQNVGVAIETAVLAMIALSPSIRRTYGVLRARFSPSDFRTLVRLGVPAGVQIASDVLAWTVFLLVIMKAYGEAALAANNYMLRFMSVSFMPALAVGTAITALVGRYVGRGMPREAARRAHLGAAMAIAYMLSCAVVFLAFRGPLTALFTDGPEVAPMLRMLLVFAAAYQLFDAVYLAYNGALRGAGDTFVPAAATAALCWGLMVGGGLVLARWRKRYAVHAGQRLWRQYVWHGCRVAAGVVRSCAWFREPLG